MNRFVKSLLRILICVPVEGADHNDLIGMLGLCEYKKFLLGCGFFVEPKSCFHAGDFVARRGAIASICRRPASLDLGLAFRWPISRARRQMRGDRIKCLGLRTYRTSCINATDSICRRARMESQSVVKRGQWARVDDKSNRSRSACGNATCGTFQHFQMHPFYMIDYIRWPNRLNLLI